MTVLPEVVGKLLTVDDYVALGEDDDRYRYRTELQEGSLVMTPSPAMRHQIASNELWSQVRTQLPTGLRAIADLDLDLALTPSDGPGWVRRPDLVVVRQDAVGRVEREGGLLRANETVLVVEILSPGSRRTDRVIKRAEYADAGIPHYWVIDLDAPASLVASSLASGGYRDAAAVSGVFTATEPFPVRMDLDALT